MIELNLVNEKESDIDYQINKFPDGQQDIVLRNLYHYSNGFSSIDKKISDLPPEVTIISRMNSFKDIEIIICATKALNGLGVKKIHLYIPYLLGARSDRKFSDGGTSYLVDVIAPILNAQNYESITVLDAHNAEVASACIKNLIVADNTKFAQLCANRINAQLLETAVLLSPDAGAMKKIYAVSEKLGIKHVVTCSKRRESGKIVSTEVPFFNEELCAIIFDDICDGGKTFIEIAKQLKARNHTGKIYLAVTHGIFSKGFDELKQYFDGIFCTNSYSNVVMGELDGDINDKFHQFNCF